MKIIELILNTNNLVAQKEFYSSVLGLKILDEYQDSVSIQVGDSVLTFRLGEKDPFYHFAINIPSFQIQDAHKWIKQKVDILSYDGEDIIKFDNWNAEAFYFYDAGRNIVEFIGRKNLNLKLADDFNSDSLLYISEIGMPTTDIKSKYNKLNREFGLEIYDGDFEIFCSIGDESGLFIVMNHEKKKWLPTMEEAKPSPFEIRFENNVGNEFEFRYENEKIIAKYI